MKINASLSNNYNKASQQSGFKFNQFYLKKVYRHRQTIER